MLEDKFGRRFHYLRLSVTDVCNFSCEYCLPDGYQCDSDRNFLSVPEIKRITSAFAQLGTSKIRITGGEPSLRKDLIEIIALCANTPGIEHVAITTNGYRLEEQVTSWAKAGLNSINVSIDSLDPRLFKSITGADKLDTILAGIDKAIALGLKVKVNGVLMRQYNANDIQSFLDWIKTKPITFRLIELMQTGDNATFFGQQHVAGEPIKQSLLDQDWDLMPRAHHAGPAQEFSHPDYLGQIGLIMPYSKDFCATCNRLRISATGKLHLCLFADNGLDIRPFLHSTKEYALEKQLEKLLGNKEATHWLEEGYTGGTKHLAMLGG